MRKLLCTSDGLVWWRIWSGNFNHQIDSGPRCNPSFESGRWSKGCSWLYDNVLWYQEETVLPREGFLLRQVQEVAASHLPIQTGTLHGKLHGKYAYFSWRVPVWAGRWGAATSNRTKRKQEGTGSPWSHPRDLSVPRNSFQKEQGGAKRCCSGTANRGGEWCWEKRKRKQTENGSELESDCPSATDETQQQRNTVVQGKEMGETNETAADKQKKETLTVIPSTPIENQRLNTGKPLLTWDA